ncbi:hypothetical protein RhiJN_20404 [Ceratobasidium sp. AG-Ba]|nr:hypothetical protein RhiJN_20404 [Ceratobasidium sp. AG-Ba]
MCPSEITSGVRGRWSSVSSEGGRRKFLFGKLELTDQEENPSQVQVQTIKVKLQWTRGIRKMYLERAPPAISIPETTPSSIPPPVSESSLATEKMPRASEALPIEPARRLINEKLAKKGHNGSAELGPLILPGSIPALEPGTQIINPKPSTSKVTPSKKQKKTNKYYWHYENTDKPALNFVFHYAPLALLQEKEIARKPGPIPLIDITGDDEDILEYVPPTLPTDSLQQSICGAAAVSPSTGNPVLPRHSSQVLQTEAEVSKSTEDAAYPGIDSSALNFNIAQGKKVDPAELSLSGLVNSSQPNQSTVRPSKRPREPTPSGLIHANEFSDDEIVLLDVKPAKLAAKRPRVKYEDEREDVKPTFEELDVKIAIKSDQEIDLWRLGC